MGAVKLEPRLPQSVHGIALDPEPDWSFDALLLELEALELKHNASSGVLTPLTKIKSREFPLENSIDRSRGAFVMCVANDDMEFAGIDDKKDHDRRLVTGRRFTCDDLYLSDDSEDEQSSLMDKAGVVEGALFEQTHEHHLGVKEDIRNQISALEMYLLGESKKCSSAIIEIEKYRDARREMDRKLDTQYQRKIAEELDSHLTAVQRDHELRSQIEERRIRSDAAFEEVKRKEKALQEEKIRQEKAKAEAEAQRKRVEEERIAALEVERKASEEAARREAAEKRIAPPVVPKEAVGPQTNASSGNLSAQLKGLDSDESKKAQLAGSLLKAAGSALNVEQARLLKLKQLVENNHALRLSSNQDFSSYERQIARWTKLITGTKESVRSKAHELIKIINDPRCPQSISIAAFGEKVVSQGERPNNPAFAIGHVIVLVTSQVPHAMDCILAEFHKACIYTVPKHISYSKAAFSSKEAYYKTIGYREDDGKCESDKDYLRRLESYMQLYGALVQTEIQGIQNVHGLEEGWVWLARFLNSIPANKYTAVALWAFLKVAGFALYRRYKSQFMKILNVIYDDFLKPQVAGKDSVVNKIVVEIQTYIKDRRFLQEPEGWRLQDSMLSSNMAPELEQYGSPSNRYFY